MVAPPFPRSVREGGLSPRARHPFVLASALSIAIRSRPSLPSPLHSEQSCSISNPLASPPVLALPDCDACSAASLCVSPRSIPGNRNSGPAKRGAGPSFSNQDSSRGCPTLPAFLAGGWALARSTTPIRSPLRASIGIARFHHAPELAIT